MFEWNVGRHLAKIANHVSRSDWQDSDVRIELDRSQPNKDEDIEVVVDAICTARRRAHNDFARLTDEIERRKIAEYQLRLRQDELEQAYREQSEFTYAISHDMKSPTNTIKLLSSDLRDHLHTDMDEDLSEIVDDLETTVGRMSSLIDDVLQYATSAGEATVKATVDLNEVAEELVSDLKSDLRSSNAKLNIGSLPAVHGDRSQLRLLLQNLISNGLKFSSRDREPIVTVDGFSDHGSVKIRVKDNGIGIAQEHHERIFGMFQRLHSKAEFEGTGLGLTLCKRIALNHNGEIRVSSESGEGTTFEVTLRETRSVRSDDKDGYADR